jgi:hypothetical protein
MLLIPPLTPGLFKRPYTKSRRENNFKFHVVLTVPYAHPQLNTPVLILMNE